jgi:8-amino-7-oxononanoate synthase
MSEVWQAHLEKELAQLEREGNFRSLHPVEEAQQPVLIRGGRRLVNLSSNNYLGLAGHPDVIQAAQTAARRGAGSTASRLITGDDEAAESLERRLADWKGTEAAIVFGSGYMANVGILSALLGREDMVFSDWLNHASIIDGIRLSRAVCHRYRHRDLDHLEAGLKRAVQQGKRRLLIVTDSVFSMDGDTAPLQDLVFLKEKYGAALMVDEAHGSGVFGPRGEGLAALLGLSDRIDLHMGTFSKAFGVYGAYAAGRETWIRYLVNKCRSFIFTTALPPAVIGSIHAALDHVIRGTELRQSLSEKAKRFRERLQQQGWDTSGSETQIVPIVIGGNREASAFSRYLEERGILGVAIRPPTVPEGTSRIRFSLMATHREEDLEQVMNLLKEARISWEVGRFA